VRVDRAGSLVRDSGVAVLAKSRVRIAELHLGRDWSPTYDAFTSRFDPFGVGSGIGINYTVLPPGKESSMRHWHTHEDEFVYIVEGEVVLRTDEGEQVMRTGMAAGFPAGDRNGHQLINRTDRTAVYLVISNRDERDGAEYSDPDVDLAYRGGKMVRRDGSAL